MPEWVVHLFTGANFCGIGREVYEEVNKLVDLGEHDAGRDIEGGRWNLAALLYAALPSYDGWGYEGLKALLHHHLLDYSNTLVGTVYGWLVKDYYRLEDVATKVAGFCGAVLSNIVDDIAALIDPLRGEAALREAILKLEVAWGEVQQVRRVLAGLLRDRAKLTGLLRGVLEAVEGLAGCLDSCAKEVVWLRFNRFRVICPLCMWPPRSSYVPIPMEYAEKGLAYKLHRECFERLRTKAEGLLKQGLIREEAFKRLLENSMPPSVAWEALMRSPQAVVPPGGLKGQAKERPPRDELFDWLMKLLGRPR